MKKLKMLVLFLLVLAIGFGSCFGAAKKVKITVGCFPALDAAYTALLPEFNKLYPNLEVEIQSLGYADHHNMLVTSVAAGEKAPDVAAIDIGYIAQFAAEGGMSNLLKSPFYAKKYKKGISPYKWAQAMTDDHRLIAMPVDIAPGCAFYRRDVFEANGINIEDIKSMEDLFEAGKKITKDTDGDGKIDQWLLSDASTLAQAILRSAPQTYFDEKGKCLVDNERFQAAFTWAKKFKDAGMTAQIGAWTNEWYVSFQNGTVAYELCGAWLGGHLKNWMAPKTAGKWGVARWPALKAGEKPMAAGWGGSFLAIPEQSKHKREAWQFVEFASTNISAQLKSFEVADAFPSWMPSWNNEVFKEKQDFFGGQQTRLLWIDIAKNIPQVVTNRYDNVANSIVTTELGAVLNQGKSVAQALKDAKTQIERRIRRR